MHRTEPARLWDSARLEDESMHEGPCPDAPAWAPWRAVTNQGIGIAVEHALNAAQVHGLHGSGGGRVDQASR